MNQASQNTTTTATALDTYEGEGGDRLTFYPFRGRMCVVALEVDPVLGYAPGSIADLIAGEWAGEFKAGEHFEILRGKDLRDFKAAAHATGAAPVASKTSQVTVLTEAGVDRVCLLTKKPAGIRLRAYLADKVLPKLRRGEAVVPTSADPPPVFAPVEARADMVARPPTLDLDALAVALDERVARRLLVLKTEIVAAVREDLDPIAGGVRAALEGIARVNVGLDGLRAYLTKQAEGVASPEQQKAFQQQVHEMSVLRRDRDGEEGGLDPQRGGRHPRRRVRRHRLQGQPQEDRVAPARCGARRHGQARDHAQAR
jgi:hypothetical protein